MTDAATDDAPAAAPRKWRGRRDLAWVVGSLGVLIEAVIVGFLLWANIGVMAAEPDALAAVRDDPAVTLTDEGAAWVLAPIPDAEIRAQITEALGSSLLGDEKRISVNSG